MRHSLYVLACSVWLLVAVLAIAGTAQAADPSAPNTKSDPLIQILVSKGILTAQEAYSLQQGRAAEQQARD